MAVRRISIGPGEVAGYFSSLKAGFDELDIPCEHFVLIPNKFNYQESDYFLRSVYVQLAKLRNVKYRLIRYVGYCLEVVLRLFVFIYAIIRCDVFITSGFGSFFRFYELPLMKLLGKKIVVVYLGTDARPAYLSGKHLDDVGKPFDCLVAKKETVRQVKMIRKVEQYADIIINHTATAQFFTRDFIRLHALGIPIKSHMSLSHTALKQSNVTHILHAPSRPLAKGSLVFKQAIEELRAEGYEIDFIELVGVANSVVLQELEQCDFVLDELYSDVPMAMLATEAAVFGKPVIVGGYYAKQYKIDNPNHEYPPSLYVVPSDIKGAIRRMIDDKDFRLTLGKQAQKFVKQSWNTRKVAENYLRLIESNDVPNNWRCDPVTLPYYWGWGLSQENWRQQVGDYISQCGSDGLLLNHNPVLRDSILIELQQNRDTRSA